MIMKKAACVLLAVFVIFLACNEERQRLAETEAGCTSGFTEQEHELAQPKMVAVPKPQTSGEEGGFMWELSGDGVKITGYTSADTVANIPPMINGKSVTMIGEYALSGVYWDDDALDWIPTGEVQLTGVTIPDSVTVIDNWAFRDNLLTDVTIPGSVLKIGFSAFENNQLTSVTLLPGIVEIGHLAFAHNQLTEITIPDSVTNIEFSAFLDNKITGITIPDSVTNLGDQTFANNQLTSLTIGNGITRIDEDTFAYNKLTNVTVPENVRVIMDGAFRSNRITDVTIGSGVTSIQGFAFEGNILTGIVIPDSVTRIGGWAFGNWASTYRTITRITIGSNVEFTWAGMRGAGDETGGFGSAFDEFYKAQNRSAGTYTLNGGNWTFPAR